MKQEQEIWKDIEGYEGRYQVSNLGRVRSKASGRCRLRKQHSCNGYQKVGLASHQRTKTFSVHRLVAFAFCDGYVPGYHVNHRDEDKSNNHADNLEWLSPAENIVYGTRIVRAAVNIGKSLSKAVEQYDMDGVYLRTFDSVSVAAAELSLNRWNISSCCKGKRHSCGGYRWAFKPVKVVADKIQAVQPLQLLLGEEWRDAVGYEGRYKISNMGRVYSLTSKRLIKPKKHPKGYLCVTMSDGVKTSTEKVHRLVAFAFCDGYKPGLVVNHKNERKADNRAENLEWVTIRDNLVKGTVLERIYENNPQKIAVLQLNDDGNIINEYSSISHAAKAVGISHTAIYLCLKGDPKHPHAGGYKWKFKNNNKK